MGSFGGKWRDNDDRHVVVLWRASNERVGRDHQM
jgi:hypothetical protein